MYIEAIARERKREPLCRRCDATFWCVVVSCCECVIGSPFWAGNEISHAHMSQNTIESNSINNFTPSIAINKTPGRCRLGTIDLTGSECIRIAGFCLRRLSSAQYLCNFSYAPDYTLALCLVTQKTRHRTEPHSGSHRCRLSLSASLSLSLLPVSPPTYSQIFAENRELHITMICECMVKALCVCVLSLSHSRSRASTMWHNGNDVTVRSTPVYVVRLLRVC